MASMVATYFQQVTKTSRAITQLELDNLDVRMLMAESWEKFRDWLYSAITLVNDQKLQRYWDKGFIVGFLGPELTAEILHEEQPGVFLIRFSDSTSQAELTINYATSQGQKSILLTQADLKAQSLPERLRALETLQNVYAGSKEPKSEQSTQKSSLTPKDQAFLSPDSPDSKPANKAKTVDDPEFERRERKKQTKEFESFLKEVLTKD